jgi:hypothetical protein
MQDQQSQGGWRPVEDARKMMGLGLFVAKAMSSPLEVMLRTDFGVSYFGPAAVAGFFAPLLWTTLWPRERGIGWLVCFWFFYLIMQARARFESVRMVHRGQLVHTRYNGTPRLLRRFPNMTEQQVKERVEPMLVLVTGFCVLAWSPPLGSYLICGAIALAMVQGAISHTQRAQVLAMNDAMIEQRLLLERLRRMQQGHFH